MIATILRQSNKLVELGIDPSTADMVLLHEEPYETSNTKFDGLHEYLIVPFKKYDKGPKTKYRNISYFPAWSLSELLKLMPFHIIENNVRYEFQLVNGLDKNGKTYRIKYKGPTVFYETLMFNNPIDAAFEMICWLKENKYI